ncbi:MAG: GNAT family N-acetyltransferase [Xanthobacteraceae bacterium]|nr:GNAT family N-acetyltransferase [Xanthobacteraceae bacterium]
MVPAQELVGAPDLVLRPYIAQDEDTAIALWQRTWQQAYPQIDFAARVPWWRERWRAELVTACVITVATVEGAMSGFVTVDPRSGYLDQLVVAPEAWGSGAAAALIAAAKSQSPERLELHVNRDNIRAVRFYQKHGFFITGEETNPRSGAPVYRMSWRAP